jgi:hypothetical protein
MTESAIELSDLNDPRKIPRGTLGGMFRRRH